MKFLLFLPMDSSTNSMFHFSCSPFRLLLLLLLVHRTLSSIPFKVNQKFVIEKGKLQDFLASHDSGINGVYFYKHAGKGLDNLVTLIDGSFHEMDIHGVHFGVYDCTNDFEELSCKQQTDSGELLTFYRGEAVVKSLNIQEILKHSGGIQYDALFYHTLSLKLSNQITHVETTTDLNSQLELCEKANINMVLLVTDTESKTGIPKDYLEYMKLVSSVGKFHHHLNFTVTSHRDVVIPTELQNEMMQDLGLKLRSQLFVYKCRVKGGISTGCVQKYSPVRIDQGDVNDVLNSLAYEDQIHYAHQLHTSYSVCFYTNDDEKAFFEELVISIDESLFGIYVMEIANREDTVALEYLGNDANLVEEKTSGCFINDFKLMKKSFVKIDELESGLIDDFIKYRIMSLENDSPPQHKGDKSESEELSAEDIEEAKLAVIQKVETEDDALVGLEIDQGGRPGLSLKHVNVLTKSSWNSNEYSGIVLFHLKRYDHRSRLVMRIFDLVAESSDVEFSVLDCYDWTDVCRDHRVTTFPTIRSYKQGKMTPYSGDFSEEGLTRLSKLYKYSVPEIVSTLDEVTDFKTKLSALGVRPVIGVFKSNKDTEYREFVRAARRLFGQRLLIASTTAEFSQQVAWFLELGDLPAVALFDPDNKSAEKLESAKLSSADMVRSYALRTEYDVFPELTSSNMMHIIDRSKLQLFVFINKQEQVAVFEAFAKLADKKHSKFQMSYLDLTVGVNQVILNSLINKEFSSLQYVILLVNYKTGKIYELKDLKTEESELVTQVEMWVGTVFEGTVDSDYKLSDGVYKPLHPGYNFLDMIDKGKKALEHDRLHRPDKSDNSDKYEHHIEQRPAGDMPSEEGEDKSDKSHRHIEL